MANKPQSIDPAKAAKYPINISQQLLGQGSKEKATNAVFQCMNANAVVSQSVTLTGLNSQSQTKAFL